MTDDELFILLRQGDADAFEAVYDRYFIPLMNAAFKRVRSAEDAREIVQEIFVQLYIKRTEIKHTRHLSGYLHTLLRNKVIDNFREMLSRKKYYSNLKLVYPTIAPDTGGTSLDGKLLEEKLGNIISQLPEKCREVFLLSRVKHLPHQEIAKKLDISVSTVEKHIGKALKIVREKVEKYYLYMLLIISIAPVNLTDQV